MTDDLLQQAASMMGGNTHNPVPEALATLKKVMVEDPDYAWGWHCNIAQCAHAEGLSHAAANRAAARFMHILFNLKLEDYQQ